MTIFRPREGETGAVWFSVLLGVFVAFGGVLYGYDTGIIGGILAMRFWKDSFSTGYRNRHGELDVSSSQGSLVVSILSVGTFFGALSAAYIADLVGRRLSLSIGNAVFVAGVALQTASTAIPAFTAGRCLAGLGVGIISAAIPLYQSKTAPKRLRGTIVGTYQLSIALGLLISALVNNATKDRNDRGSYRIPVAVQFVWAIFLFTGTLFLPESPRYLIKKGSTDKALTSLSRLRRTPADDPSLQAEFQELRLHYEHELSLGSATWADCYKGNNFNRLAISCVLQALQQLTGVNFIFYFGTTFFQNSGIQNPFVITMITNSINTAATLPELWAVEKLGRRKLLLIGAIGMCVCQLIVGIVGTAGRGTSAQKALVAFVCFFIFFFASTWGIGAWVVSSELFFAEGPGNAGLGAKVFFIWGGSCLISIIFTYFFIFETRGLNLEEIDELFKQVPSAQKSPSFRPSIRAQAFEPRIVKRNPGDDEKATAQQHVEFR